MINEVWKKHPKLMPYYEISNLGNFRVLDYTTTDGKKIKQHLLTPKPLKRQGRQESTTYLRIGARTRSGEFKDFLAHRLVAETWIPNPKNKPQVDHINENKNDNRVKNLRWVTNKENHNHGTGHRRTAEHPNSLKVYQKLSTARKTHHNKTRQRYLVVGDIHAKIEAVNKIKHLVETNQFDKVVFLGDYVDDWTASPEQSYNTLKELVNIKIREPDKIILLSGNHCQSYASAGAFRCSGFDETTRSMVKDLYKTEIDSKPIFQFAYAKGNYLFTHAGLTNNFWKQLKETIKKSHPELHYLLKPYYSTTDIATILNECFNRGAKNSLDDLFQLFSQAGPLRGGFGIPSPIWADKDELLKDPVYRIKQVVGHTPVQTIEFYPKRGNRQSRPNIIFCDTLSTWYEPYTGLTFSIGDKSLLQLTFGTLNAARIDVIPKKDWLTK